MSEVEQKAADTAAAQKADADKALRDKADTIALENEVKAAEKRLTEARAQLLVAAKPKVMEFVGLLNGPFVASGENLGKTNPMGGVKINGITARVTAVRAGSVKGIVPVDVKAGPVTVVVGDAAPFAGKVY